MPAPEAVGDIVPGQPPVPITVWHVPAARPGETMSLRLAERLVMNFTHGRRLVLDLTVGHQLTQATVTARRRHLRLEPAELAGGTGRAALIVSGWPLAGALDDAPAGPFLGDCAARLMAGGCVAVVLGCADLTVYQTLIAAARNAGLTYLQHIVAAHDLSGRRGRLGDGGTHLRVHTDVLVFAQPQHGGADG